MTEYYRAMKKRKKKKEMKPSNLITMDGLPKSDSESKNSMATFTYNVKYEKNISYF